MGILKSYVTHMQLRHHRYLEDSFSWDDDNESLCLKEEREQVTMQETWVQSLGWEDPLEKATAVHSSTLAWKNLMDGGA